MTDHAGSPIEMPTEQDIINELLAAQLAIRDGDLDGGPALGRVLEMYVEQDRIIEGMTEVCARQIALLCDPETNAGMRPWKAGSQHHMALLIALLLLLLLFGGGFAVHALWIVAVVLLVIAVIGLLTGTFRFGRY